MSKIIGIGSFLVGMLCCAQVSSADLHREANLLLKNVIVVSPEKAHSNAKTDVLINDGKIVKIGKGLDLGEENHLRQIDGKGRFLAPGLIDSHVHLSGVPGMSYEQQQAHPEIVSQALQQIPRSYLYHGFTTLIDLNSSSSRIAQWNAQEIRPQAYFCGAAPIMDGYPMRFIPKHIRYKLMTNFVLDQKGTELLPEGVKREEHSPEAVVARIQDDGAICVKTHHESGFGGNGNWPVPGVELIQQLVNAAHQKHLPVLLHANSQNAQQFGIQAGVDAFAHGMWTWNNKKQTSLNEEIRAIADQAITKQISLQPTIQVLYGERDVHDPDYLTDPKLAQVLPSSLIKWYQSEQGQWWKNRMLEIPIIKAQIAEAGWSQVDADAIARVSAVSTYYHKQKANLFSGSDTPSDQTFANPPGLNGRFEVARWQQIGVPADVMFNAATLNNAAFFGLQDDLGSVEVGKRADLLLMSKNPRKDYSAYDSIDLIIVNGRAISRSELSALE